MAREDKIILTVERSILFPEKHFQGFSSAEAEDFRSRILDNYIWMRRGNDSDKHSAEGHIRFKHPIAYTLVVNPELKKVFAYQRAKKDEKYFEKRLQGKWSWGVGGHIDLNDAIRDLKDPIYESLKREVGTEEIEFVDGKLKDLNLLGYINDERDFVGQVHFGILYLAITNATIVNPRDEEVAEGKLRTISEIEQICKNPEFKVESWSRIALEPLRKILS